MLNRNHDNEFRLDPFQRTVAWNVDGCTILEGGPGTGKTHVVVARVAALLESGVSPDQITCLTGSPQAAADLHERLRRHERVGAELPAIFVGTVDQFANLWLRQCGKLRSSRLSPHYSLWDRSQAEDEAVLALRAANGLQVARPQVRRALHWHWSNQRRPLGEDDLPAEDASWFDIREIYRRAKELQNALDVEDLAVVLMAIMREQQTPDGRNDRCRHLLVDQAEDITPREAEMLQLLANPAGSLLVATDPNQPVGDPQFEWVGRSWRWRFGQAARHGLTVSQSGTQPLSELANCLNRDPAVGELTADGQGRHPAPGPMPCLVEVAGPWHAVVRRCVDDIRRLQDEGILLEDVAVLYRHPNALRRMKTMLVHLDVPYRVLDERRLQRPTDARWIVAMLNAALNPRDLAAVRIAAAPGHPNKERRLRDGIAEELLNTAREGDINLINAAALNAETSKDPDRDDLAKLVEYWRRVDGWLDDDRLNLVELLARVTAMCRPSQAGGDNDEVEPETRWLWRRCFDLPTLPGEGLREHLQRFLDLISPALGQGGEHTSEPGLTCSTMRAAKGRQWPVVMILDVSDQTIPGKVGGDRLKREQRMLFTAITRATERLYLYCQVDTGPGNAFVLTRFLQPLKHLLAHDPDDGQVQLRSVEATPKHAENGPDER